MSKISFLKAKKILLEENYVPKSIYTPELYDMYVVMYYTLNNNTNFKYNKARKSVFYFTNSTKNKAMGNFNFYYTNTQILNEQMADVKKQIQKLLFKKYGKLNIEITHYTNELSGTIHSSCHIDISKEKDHFKPRVFEIQTFENENYHSCFPIAMRKFFYTPPLPKY